jgi:hypothetical protein
MWAGPGWRGRGGRKSSHRRAQDTRAAIGRCGTSLYADQGVGPEPLTVSAPDQTHVTQVVTAESPQPGGCPRSSRCL